MRFFRQASRGLRALFHGAEADRGVDEELEHFLIEATREHERRGLSPADARRAALQSVGNITVTREEVRSSGWEHGLDTLIGDVRHTLRWLRSSPAFTISATVTLALGIGTSTAVFSAINPILLRPLPFPNAERIVTVADRTQNGGAMAPTLGSYVELAARSRSFDVLAAADGWQPSLIGTGEPERLVGQRVTPNYFDVFSATPLAGRTFVPDDARTGGTVVVILAEAFVERRFGGDRAIVGKTIDLNGQPCTIIGVMPRSFANVLAPATDVWMPLEPRVTSEFSSSAWGHHFTLVGRLTEHTTVERATRELDAIGAASIPQFARPSWASLQQGLLLRSVRDDIAGPVKPALLAIVGAVFVLLAIACVNVTNLLLARSAQRQPELAMRAALGASSGRLIRQLVTESVVLACCGGTLGVAVAELVLRALVAASPPGLPRVEAIRLDGSVLLFALATTTLVGIAMGVLPALSATSKRQGAGLHRGTRTVAARHGAMRSALVIAEVALALVLLINAGLLLRTMQSILAVPAGFDATHVVTLQTTEAGRAFDSPSSQLLFLQQSLDAVRQVPGVRSAAFTSQLPLSGDVDGYGFEALSVPASRGGGMGSAMRYAVTPDYFAALGIPLRAGRLLDASDRVGSARSVVISAAMAKTLFGDRNPLGEQMRFGPEMNDTSAWHTVVGVVGDVKHFSLVADAPNAFYVVNGHWTWVDRVNTLVVRTSGDPMTIAPLLKRAVWSVSTHVPIQRIRTMDSFIEGSAGQRRFALLVIEAFAVAALVLAAVGLYGVISGGVIERFREIGIRTALGAAPGRIAAEVLRRSFALTGIGVAIGVLGAVVATRWLSSMLYGVSRVDPITYIGVTALLGVTAGVAAWIPARKAVRVDPTVALRAE